MTLDLTSLWRHDGVMTDWIYTEELMAQLRRPVGRAADRTHDRDVARLLSPWRRSRGGGHHPAREG